MHDKNPYPGGHYPILDHTPRARFSRRLWLYAVLGSVLSWGALVGMVVLIASMLGCSEGYSISRANQVNWTPNLTQAHSNVALRDPGWIEGLNGIDQVNEPPPPGVNYAVVECDGHRSVFFATTFDLSVKNLEGLIVHEAFEARNGCTDMDDRSKGVVKCYHAGGTVEECEAQAFPWRS